ncbi:MAG: PKD domain-containing protein [Chitinophagales bacterium]
MSQTLFVKKIGILLLAINACCFSYAEKSHLHAAPSTLRFTENLGQWDAGLRFRAKLAAGAIFCTDSFIGIWMYDGAALERAHHHGDSTPIQQHYFRIRFNGANPHPVIRKYGPSASYENFFLGNNPARWKSQVHAYETLVYQELWPGIDMQLEGDGDGMKYSFLVKPGADFHHIDLCYEGVSDWRLNEGELHYQTSIGQFRELAPVAWKSHQKSVSVAYRVDGEQHLRFSVNGSVSSQDTLVIDPTLVFSSYTGATADNWGYTATYDAAGNMYIGGYINQSQFGGSYPTSTGAFQSSWGGGDDGTGSGDGAGIGFACDMGITKFNSSGTAIMYSTYIGGSSNETPNSLVVDDQNNLLIYGVSYSSNYPVTPGAYKTTKGGLGDIVVTKLNSSGTALVASTFVGGSGEDGINFDGKEFSFGNLKRNYGDQNRGEILVDNAGNAYVASSTFSTDFPVTPGAPQTTNHGGQDGCLFKINSSLSSLIYSTYLGGTSDDACYSIALDKGLGIYVCGGTMSSNFPTSAGVLHSNYQGGLFDGFLCHIGTGGNLLRSTYLGTPGNDQVYFVKLDYEDSVYVVGQTTGAYPVQNANYSNPNSGQFIAQLRSDLSAHVFSTVFGNGSGAPNVSPTAFLVDTCKNIYVAGWGTNDVTFQNFQNPMFNMPITNDALKSSTDGTDFYFIVLKKQASSLLYGSYFGGNGIEHVDGGTSRFDPRGVIYEAICAGCGGSSFTPTTPGVWAPNNGSPNCNELGLKLAFNLSGTKVTVKANPRSTGCVPLTVNFVATTSPGASVTWYFGDGATSNQFNPVHTYTDTGVYQVMLVGVDPNSCNNRDTAYIDVWVRNDSLTANFLPNLQVSCYQKQLAIGVTNYPTSSYLWNFGDGTTSSAAGNVVKTYTNPGTYNVKLTVTDTTKCNLQTSFNTQVYVPPVVRVALQPVDTIGCIPLTVSFGNVTNNTNAGAYTWYFGDGDSSNLKNPTHTYLHGGNYTAMVILDDTLSCNKKDTAYIRIIAVDSFADASFITTNQFYFCDSVRVQVQSFYNTEQWEFWNFGDGFTSTSNPVTHTYYAPTFDTITHFIYDSTKICKQYDTAKVIISLNPLTTRISVPDSIGCVPFTATLYGVSPLLTTHFYWFFPDGDSASGTPVQHTFSPTGTYPVYCISIDSNACVNRDSNVTQIVVIDDSTRANFSIQILNDCDSDLYVKLTNTSTNATHYVWNYGNGQTSTDTNSAQHYNLPGTYTISLWAEDTSRCHPRDSITKTVTLKPNSIIDFELEDICLGQTVFFLNKSNPKATYNWLFGDGQSSGLYSPSHTYQNFGVYQVQLQMVDTSTCNVYDTLTKPVTVYAQPIAAYATPGDTFWYEHDVVFTNESQFYNTSVWTFEDGFVTNETSPVYAFHNNVGWTTVCLEVYNAGAPCRDTLCDSIYIRFQALLGVPNAFSPNGDGVNDRVYVEGRGIVKLEFRIYNRWGQLVYHGTDQKEGWDGTYHGEPQEMEVYTYTVDAWLINKQYVPLKGNITLLR